MSFQLTGIAWRNGGVKELKTLGGEKAGSEGMGEVGGTEARSEMGHLGGGELSPDLVYFVVKGCMWSFIKSWA